MQIDHLIPQNPAQWFGLGLATILAAFSGWFMRRKREPVELARISAETRQITVNTDVSLIQAATTAIAKAERLQSERDHWERKATDLMLDLEDSRGANSEKDIRLKLHEYQAKRMKGLLDAHGISYSEVDRPRESDP